MTYPRRGETYWVNLDPTIGTEIAKNRLAVILSNDVGNRFSSRVIVAPITSQDTDRIYPFEVLLSADEGGLDRDSKILLDQIRTVDKKRLGRRLGTLPVRRVREMDRAARLSLAL